MSRGVGLTIETLVQNVRKNTVVVPAQVCALAACAIAAVGTAVWILRFGLIGPRPPLSDFQTVVRFAIFIGAVALFFVRRERLERTTLVCAMIAAGSSALFGVGIRNPALSAVRLIAHLAAYSMGAIAFFQMLRAPGRWQ